MVKVIDSVGDCTHALFLFISKLSFISISDVLIV